MNELSYLIAGMLLLSSGCGGSEDTNPAEDADRESVFDPLAETLDRAKGVEDTLRESAERRRRQLEEEEG